MALCGALRNQEELPIELLDSPKVAPKSIGHSYTLTREISQKPLILAWIRLLSEMVGQRLRQANLEAKTLYLYLHSSNQAGISKQKTFYQATYDGFEIYTRCLKILKNSSKTLKSLKLLGIIASNLYPPERPYLFVQQNRREALISALDRINDKFGSRTIFPASVIQINK